MHFAFSDQQTEFREAVRQVLANECTTGDLREAFDRPSARGHRWDTLAELGVVGVTVPEAQGGLGLGLVDLVLLLEEAGRVALPEPLLETTALAGPLLAALGAEGTVSGSELGGQRHPPWGPAATWSEAIAAGQVAAAVAAPSTAGMPFARHPVPVAGAAGADLFVLAREGSGPAEPELHVVDAGAVSVEPIASLDPTRRLGIPHWRPTTGTRVLAGVAAASALRHLADRAAVATGAELLGLSERMITLAAEYAKERRQFGKPIGSFQAVKHLLAGARVRLEFARPVVYGAAWAVDHSTPDASRAASVAKAYASESALEAARVSLQVHGAIGYTWECDLHLFLKRAWALAEAWGSAADHRALVLESLLAEA